MKAEERIIADAKEAFREAARCYLALVKGQVRIGKLREDLAEELEAMAESSGVFNEYIMAVDKLEKAYWQRHSESSYWERHSGKF